MNAASAEPLMDDVSYAVETVLEGAQANILTKRQRERLATALRVSLPGGSAAVASSASEANGRFDLVGSVQQQMEVLRTIQAEAMKPLQDGRPMHPKDLQTVLQSTNSMLGTLQRLVKELRDDFTAKRHMEATERAISKLPTEHQDQFFRELEQALKT